jgi:hypothetical protein
MKLHQDQNSVWRITHRQVLWVLPWGSKTDDGFSCTRRRRRRLLLLFFFYWFYCEAPHAGIKDPKSSVSKVCMHGISHMTRSRWWSGYPHSYHNRKKILSGSVWRNQESDWGTTWLCCHMTGASAISLTEISLTHSSDLVEARGFMRWQFFCSPLSPHPPEQDSVFTFLHWLSVLSTWIHSFSI